MHDSTAHLHGIGFARASDSVPPQFCVLEALCELFRKAFVNMLVQITYSVLMYAIASLWNLCLGTSTTSDQCSML